MKCKLIERLKWLFCKIQLIFLCSKIFLVAACFEVVLK